MNLCIIIRMKHIAVTAAATRMNRNAVTASDHGAKKLLDSAAVPAAPAVGTVNVRAEVSDLRLSMMTIVPFFAASMTGVSVTLMVTAVAPFATLFRLMAGALAPRLSTIAG